MARIIFNYLQLQKGKKRLSLSRDITHTHKAIYTYSQCIIDIFFKKYSDQMTKTREGGFPDTNVHMQTYQSFMWSIYKCMAMKRTMSMPVQTHMTRWYIYNKILETEYSFWFSHGILPLILALVRALKCIGSSMFILSCNRLAILCSTNLYTAWIWANNVETGTANKPRMKSRPRAKIEI